MLLSVDPGNDTGFALWTLAGELVTCGLSDRFPVEGVTRAIIELPKVYPTAQMKGDPNDLIKLAVRVGRYQERLEVAGAKVELVLPRTWKGTIPKETHNLRAIRDMTPREAGLVATCCVRIASGKLNNVIDAVALGKWALAR